MTSISAQQRPLAELEDANAHADALLTTHADILTVPLIALLSTLRADLTMIIEEHYGITPGDDETGTRE